MRVRREAKHNAIHFRCGYGNGKTAFAFSRLVHYASADITMEIAISNHDLVSVDLWWQVSGCELSEWILKSFSVSEHVL